MSLRSPRAQRGFSLLEVLVAFAIMALSLAVLYRTSGGSVRAVADAERYERAVRTARSVLALQDGVPESGLFIDGVDGSMRWQLRTAAYPLPAAAAGSAVPLHRVDVEVTFGDPERPQSVTLSSLLPQLRPPPGVPR